jgi:hypothetical protein
MELPTKTKSGSPAHKEKAAVDKALSKPLVLAGKIKKLSNSAVTKVDVAPDPNLNSGPSEPSKNPQINTERILMEQVPQKRKIHGLWRYLIRFWSRLRQYRRQCICTKN